MRSSKSRSRNKSNRQRSIGNIVNRVFDSSGPEGKVRGTPQQIIDKYLMLARDAQLGNDRVAEQNFLQHAEHYTRMLGEAQRELAREQEERSRQYQSNGNGNGNGGNNGNTGNRDRNEPREGGEPRFDEPVAMPEPLAVEEEDSGLVETPEMRAEERSAEPEVAQPSEDSAAPAPAEAGEEVRTPRPRTRRPRKPKAESTGEGASAEVPSAE
ncbi:MAG: DUF4167 domain-containing protein [Paenirhodobacter sp.]|uniref:DUF4167 domain-containing protein n=1 Tax=Paenirhodobacter sp. TaxID=1965326 RepID=UPI003D0A2E67